MNERIPFPFEVYNRPGSVMYDTDDGNFVLVDLEPTQTIIQYPRSWYPASCELWAAENEFPVPEFFGGTPEGCLMFGPNESWCGNILNTHLDNH